MSFVLLHHKLADCRRIYLRNHEIYINIGALEHEKGRDQRVIINVDLFVPLKNSTPIDDQLYEVVDYDLIKLSIAECVKQKHIRLQETLCDTIASRLLLHDAVIAARVSTEKPDAYLDCDTIGVEIFRIKNKKKSKNSHRDLY
ncbi:MAG: dihydroneopterin aldolase [Burkholderia sp.]|nr:dihydroneopterin aldolase [Burkholderia sp.]